MNSDLMPSSESPKSTASGEVENANAVSPEVKKAEQASELENASITKSENTNDENLVNRMHPIPPPSEPMQYRAIGLVRGRYIASSEQFTQGILLTKDGIELDSVLLGRIMSLVKNHIDLEKEHLWVVYPRTRQENDKLHIQIVGIWEPENLAKHQTGGEDPDSTITENQTPDDELPQNLTPSSEIPDSGFSVRGEVVYQSSDTANLVIKIRQAARKPDDKPKYFKLKLTGKIDGRAVGKFWDMQVKREGDALEIKQAEFIADLPKKRRPPFKGGGGKPFKRGGAGKPYPRRDGEMPRPTKRVGSDTQAASRPAPSPSRPTPKPIKRPKPPEE